MDYRIDDEEWGKVARVGYCPIMSRSSDLADCQKEKCAWWRRVPGGRLKGNAGCAVNDLVSHLGALNRIFPLALKEIVSQLVISNGRLQALLQGKKEHSF